MKHEAFATRIQALAETIISDYGHDKVIDRLEMFTQPDRQIIEELIAKHNLYTGGGTDHHGYMEGCPFYEVGSDKNRERSVPRAMFGVSEEHFRQLKERALG